VGWRPSTPSWAAWCRRGVGFDISCGVRTLLTGLRRDEVEPVKAELAGALYRHIPAGVGSTGRVRLGVGEMDDMLRGGARWAVAAGFGGDADLERVEEGGRMAGADPEKVSEFAKRRQRDETGTLGSGNHYAEVQEVAEVFDAQTAARFGIASGDVVLSIHCGSRGLGHQIGTDYLKRMVAAASRHGIDLPDRELACAPIASAVGQDLPRRDARRDQLRARQSPGADAAGPRGLRGGVPAGPAAGALRRLAQHLQGRGPRRGRASQAAVRPPQGCDPGAGSGAPGAAAGAARRRPAGADRRQHGYRLVHPRRQCDQRGGRPGVGLPRCGPDDEPDAGDEALAGPRPGPGPGVAGHPDPQPVAARGRRGGAGAYKDVSAVVLASERAGLARRVARLRPLVCIKG